MSDLSVPPENEDDELERHDPVSDSVTLPNRSGLVSYCRFITPCSVIDRLPDTPLAGGNPFSKKRGNKSQSERQWSRSPPNTQSEASGALDFLTTGDP
ncbi:uncharacterized protein V6R79_013794 [Siganus canaliculatus]